MVGRARRTAETAGTDTKQNLGKTPSHAKVYKVMVLRYLATVIRVCAPSDLVAYRQHHHHYNGDPVVSHFACSFKYPHHLNEYVEELPEFWHQSPRNDSQRKRSSFTCLRYAVSG